MKYGYASVSTDDQNRAAARHRWGWNDRGLIARALRR